MGEKRPRVGSVWEIHTGVVRVTGHEPDTVRLEWESGYYPAGTSDSCGPMMFTHAKPLSPDPWEPTDGETQEGLAVARKGTASAVSSSVPPPQASEGPTARPGATDGGGQTTPRVRVGQVWRFPSAPGIEYTVHAIDGAAVALRFHGDQEAYSYINDRGIMRGGTLIRDVEEPAANPLFDVAKGLRGAMERHIADAHYEASRIRLSPETLEAARNLNVTPLSPVEVVLAHPIRPGQRYSDGRHEYAFLDEDGGTFLARRDDGLRVLVPRSRVVECAWELKGGPVEVETDREAMERVVKLEAEYPAAGETAGTWLRSLLGAHELASAGLVKNEHYGSVGQPVSYMIGDWSVTCDPAELVRLAARKARGNRGAWEAMTLEEAGR